MFFPGLRKRSLSGRWRASRPPAAPCGEADRRWQLCGARVPGPCLLSAEGPCAPPRAPPDPQPLPRPRTQPSRGKGPGPWASLAGVPGQMERTEPESKLQPAGQTLGRFLPCQPLLWILSRAPTACSPSRNLPRLCSVESPSAHSSVPIWNHPGKGKRDGLGREPL